MVSKGFTLIELLIVVAIIGILAAVGVPMYNDYIATSKYTAVKENFKIVSENAEVLLLNCDLAGSITVKANTATPSGGDQTFICKNQNTNSLSHILRDHYHFLGFINPLTGYSATWWFGTPAGMNLSNKDGYILFDGQPTNKCIIKITSTVYNPTTNSTETIATQIGMNGRVSQC